MAGEGGSVVGVRWMVERVLVRREEIRVVTAGGSEADVGVEGVSQERRALSCCLLCWAGGEAGEARASMSIVRNVSSCLSFVVTEEEAALKTAAML